MKTWVLHRLQGSGRVPHVRPSVHGPKTMFFECFYLSSDTGLSGRVSRASSEKRSKGLCLIVFVPRTLRRTRISCSRFLDTTACAAVFTKSCMQLNNATDLDRKSGERGAPLPGVGLTSFVILRRDRHNSCEKPPRRPQQKRNAIIRLPRRIFLLAVQDRSLRYTSIGNRL